MDMLYTILFFFISSWIGPFWVLMLTKPFDDLTKKWCDGFLIVSGPVVAYFLVLFMNPNILLEIFNPNPSLILEALANALGTPAGAVLTWAHIVAGDILVTRWLWKKGLMPTNQNKIRVIVLFGVMLMPIAIILATIFFNGKKEGEAIAN